MNKVELAGRVSYINKEEKSGTVITKVCIGVKKNKKDYENFFVAFFNSEKQPTAELIAKQVKKDDYIRINGKVSINKFKPNGLDKEVERLELVGWGFKKQMWNDNERKFVDIEDEPECQDEENIVQFGEEELINEDEIPF